MLLYVSLISVLIAFTCYAQAQKRGRNPLFWFAGGLLFGIFALIILLFLPIHQRRVAKGTIPIPEPMLQPKEEHHMQLFWYYLTEDKTQHGPMSFDALKRAWKEGKVRSHTFVWNEALSDWKALHDVTRSAFATLTPKQPEELGT